MSFYDKLKRFGEIISELAEFYGELPDLRVVTDNTRVFSELKKMAQRFYNSHVQGRFTRTTSPRNRGNLQTKTVAKLTLRHRF